MNTTAFDRICIGMLALAVAVIFIVAGLVVPFGVGNTLFHLTSVFANWAIGAAILCTLVTVAYFVGGKVIHRFES